MAPVETEKEKKENIGCTRMVPCDGFKTVARFKLFYLLFRKSTRIVNYETVT